MEPILSCHFLELCIRTLGYPTELLRVSGKPNYIHRAHRTVNTHVFCGYCCNFISTTVSKYSSLIHPQTSPQMLRKTFQECSSVTYSGPLQALNAQKPLSQGDPTFSSSWAPYFCLPQGRSKAVFNHALCLLLRCSCDFSFRGFSAYVLHGPHSFSKVSGQYSTP